MLLFRYTARDPATGKTVKAELEAPTERAAAKLIQEQGYTPLDIQAASDGGNLAFLKKRKIKAKDKVLFSRQLSTLINAGLPLVQSLSSVSNQTQDKNLRLIISKILTDVESGSTFADALRKYPAVFNQVYLSLVEAGETSGTLDRSLERLAIQQEKDADVARKVKGAFTYPLIVLGVMIGVVIYMMLTLLPQVQILYEGTGQQLPVFTQALLGVANFITGFWWVVIIGVAVGVFFGTRWARSAEGKAVIDRLKMKTPAIGTLFMKMYMARFARTGSTLVASGVPLLQVLDITASAVDNVHIAGSIRSAAEKVKSGKSLSESLKGDQNFLELVPGMLGIGEESGATETMMAKTADYYEKEVDDTIKNISTIIEPVMMILMGIVALVIVAAILLPIYTMSTDSLV